MIAQQSGGMPGGEILHKALGADTGPAPEQPLEMKFAQARIARQCLQVRLVLIVLFQITDRTLDTFVIRDAS